MEGNMMRRQIKILCDISANYHFILQIRNKWISVYLRLKPKGRIRDAATGSQSTA